MERSRKRDKKWGDRKGLSPGSGRPKGERCYRLINRSQHVGNGRGKKHVRDKGQG